MGGILQAISRGIEKAGASSIGEGLLKSTQSGEYSLEKQGQASGLMGKLLRLWDQTWQGETGKITQPLMSEADHVASDPVRHAEYYLQRTTGKLASDPRTAKLATTMANIQDSLFSRHQAAGFKTAPRVKGPYFADMYPRETFEAGSDLNKQAIQLIMQKRGKTAAQAAKILDTFNPNRFQNPLNSPFHHIESSRTLHLPEIARKDIAVDFEYIAGAVKRYHEKQIFGEGAKKAEVLLEAIRKESGTSGYNFARGIYSTFMGYNSEAYLGKLEREVQSFEIASHLGLAVFSHPGKTIESAIVGGLQPFAKALRDLSTDKEAFMEFGMRSGAAIHDTLHDARRMAGVENEELGKKVLRATQFQRVINFQAMLHANVGKHAALAAFEDFQQTNSKNALMRLRSLGMEPTQLNEAIQRGSLNDEDVLRAGFKMSKIVLGGRTVLDLPPIWRNNWAGRTLTMFKPFFFNQAKFIKNQIIKPALRGDMRPLLYAGIIYPALGEVVADLKNFVRGKSQDERPDWDKFPADRVLDNLSQVGAFGVANDVLNAITSATPSTTYQFLTGPVFGDLVDTIGLYHDSTEQRERFFLRRIPTIGPAVSRYLVPAKHRKKGLLESGKITKTLEKVFTP